MVLRSDIGYSLDYINLNCFCDGMVDMVVLETTPKG